MKVGTSGARTPVCDICGWRGAPVVTRSADTSVVRCPRCALHYRHPKPTPAQLTEMYGEDYFRSANPVDHGYEDYSALASSHVRMARRKARVVRRFVSKGRLLDLGAAYGYFVRAALHSGLQAEGLELSAYASGWARDRLGVPVRTGPIEAADLPPESFNAITLWDVLEHALDAPATLRRAAELLAPGGCLFVTVPDAGSLWAVTMRNWWFGYNKEDHLYFFSRRTLKRLVEQVGLVWVADWSHPWSCTMSYAVRRIAPYSRVVAGAAEAVMGAFGVLETDIDFPLIDILAVARRQG